MHRPLEQGAAPASPSARLASARASSASSRSIRRLSRIEVVRRGEVRRAKLYYLRGRTGKSARIAERRMVQRDVPAGQGAETERRAEPSVRQACRFCVERTRAHARRGAMSTAPLKSRRNPGAELGGQLLRAGRAREAASTIAPLIASGLRNPDALMVYSAACERIGKMQGCAGACQAAAQAAPDRADAWASLGRMLHVQGQSAAGAEMLERAVGLDPANAGIFGTLIGLAASSDGKLARATEALGEATRLAPRWAMAWAVLGQVQLSSDVLDEAESLRSRGARDRQPDPPSRGTTWRSHCGGSTVRRRGWR